MPTLHLTDRAVRGLETAQLQEDIYDGSFPSFGVRVTRKGSRFFFVRFRQAGRNRRVSLGRYPLISLAEARLRARSVLGDVARGLAPLSRPAPEAPPPVEEPSITFAELAAEYLERYARRRKRSWRHDELKLNLDLLPALGARPINQIKRLDVRSVIDSIVDRGSPVAANRTFALIRKIFNFALGRGYLEHSPCAGLERPSQEKSRERVLMASEIRQLWHALDEEPQLIRTAFRVLLMTAQRSSEVLGLRWSDLDGNVWMLSGEQTKAGRLQLVPLAPAVVAELEAIPRAFEEDWIFPSPRGGKGHLGTSALSHTAQRLAHQLGFAWRTHDLRRTAASHMAQLGTDRFIISRVLNHADDSVTAIYDRYSYLFEKRQALELWATRLLEIVGGEDSGTPR